MEDVRQWLPKLFGTNVGTGSGKLLNLESLIRTGKVITGFELLEMNSAHNGDQPFHIDLWLRCLQNEIKQGTIIINERPTLHNQFGKFHYDPTHRWNTHGWPQGGREFRDLVVAETGREHE